MQEGESEFVSALNVALEGFVHRTLKEQQRECVLRIVCVKKDVFAVLFQRDSAKAPSIS